jgi:Spy/CpxP family protein refolding chaperone
MFALGLAVVIAAQTSAADDQPQRKGKGKGGFGDRAGFGLLPPGAADKLKLTDEQKEKVAKIEKEYQAKQKDKFGDMREEMKKAFENKDKEAMRKAFDKMRDNREAVQKLREEYQGKVESVLTDDQKKTFADIKKERPGFGRFGGDGKRPAPGGEGKRPEGQGKRPEGSREGAQRGNSSLPAGLDQLKLTDEQKEKISKLQKDLEGKIMDVLTDEQKKKLEEMKKERRRPRNRGDI